MTRPMVSPESSSDRERIIIWWSEPLVSSSDGNPGALAVRPNFGPPKTKRPRSAAIGVFGRCEVAQGTVRPGVIVVVFPGRQHGSNLRERGKQRLIEDFIA